MRSTFHIKSASHIISNRSTEDHFNSTTSRDEIREVNNLDRWRKYTLLARKRVLSQHNLRSYELRDPEKQPLIKHRLINEITSHQEIKPVIKQVANEQIKQNYEREQQANLRIMHSILHRKAEAGHQVRHLKNSFFALRSLALKPLVAGQRFAVETKPTVNEVPQEDSEDDLLHEYHAIRSQLNDVKKQHKSQLLVVQTCASRVARLKQQVNEAIEQHESVVKENQRIEQVQTGLRELVERISMEDGLGRRVKHLKEEFQKEDTNHYNQQVVLKEQELQLEGLMHRKHRIIGELKRQWIAQIKVPQGRYLVPLIKKMIQVHIHIDEVPLDLCDQDISYLIKRSQLEMKLDALDLADRPGGSKQEILVRQAQISKDQQSLNDAIREIDSAKKQEVVRRRLDAKSLQWLAIRLFP